MIGFLKLIVCFYMLFMVLNTSDCQVTVSNLNGTGKFLCGYRTLVQCAIPGYKDGMTWKLNGTIIAQCVFGNCAPEAALPPGDNFIFDETAKTFNLDIGITYADNGTVYQCDDGLVQDQTTVNIQVPPSEIAFNTTISETNTSIKVEAGCFYPSDAGRMDVYYVNSDGTEMMVDNIDTITMTPTTTGCTGDCAGPNIYTATGSITLNSSNIGGNLKYRFKVYHINASQTEYVLSIDSSAIYKFGHSTSPPTSSTSPTTPPPPGCGEICIIIIVVCVVVVVVVVVVLLIIIIIRKRNQNKDTKEPNHAEKNDKKQDVNNITLRESVPAGMNEKKQDQNNKPTGESVHNEINEKELDLNKVEHKF